MARARLWPTYHEHFHVKGGFMSQHVYKKLELVGTSSVSIEDAINTAVNRAGESIRNMRWFEVMQVRGEIADGKVVHYQATIKLGFTLDD
jgi:flavin-binding protein dodecin